MRPHSKDGGCIVSDDGSIWKYSADGLVSLIGNDGDPVFSYNWNSETLLPNSDSGSNEHYGLGKWNGCWLGWYGDDAKESFVKYLYNPKKKEYTSLDNTSPSFKWIDDLTLVSNGDSNIKWTISGSVSMAC
jgi:hypothetical protein